MLFERQPPLQIKPQHTFGFGEGGVSASQPQPRLEERMADAVHERTQPGMKDYHLPHRLGSIPHAEFEFVHAGGRIEGMKTVEDFCPISQIRLAL